MEKGKEEEEGEGKGEEEGEGKGKVERRYSLRIRKVGRTDASTHARTHGHSGDFILCPMLCIALDRLLLNKNNT